MNKSIIIVCVLLLFGCGNNKPDEYTNNQSGIKIKREYYSNGSIKRELPYKNDSLLQGYLKFFFEDGKLQGVVHYNNGIRDGIEKWFFSNGSIQNELENKNGSAHGTLRSFWQNGKIKTEYSLFRGKYFGKQSDFNDSGNLERLRFTNLGGELLFKYVPTNDSFTYEGTPVYIAYNRSDFIMDEMVEVVYQFIVPPNFSYQLFYGLDDNTLTDISNKIDTTPYSYRYVLNEKPTSEGDHRYQFILKMTNVTTQRSINDTSFLDFNVAPNWSSSGVKGQGS